MQYVLPLFYVSKVLISEKIHKSNRIFVRTH
jgi:hypothetical protein